MNTKNLFSLALLTAVATGTLLSVACGRENSQQSDLNFVRTSATTATLEKRDLQDRFIFGLNVIETKNFFSTALNLNFRPIECELVLAKNAAGQPQLVVATPMKNGRREKLLSFDVRQTTSGKIDVDFNTAGNDLSLWNSIGGATVDSDAGKDAGAWKTAGQPKVVKVVQDPNSVIVDIIHQVSFTRAKSDSDATKSQTGSVKIRLFLKRQDKNAQVFQRTTGMALAENIGYFASARMGPESQQLPIAHYKIDVTSKRPAQQIIYLKDFPSDFEAVAKKAIESWNITFGFDAFKAQAATADIDLGDPRYNVVKWIDDLDEDVPWAGYAPTMVNPVTGEVVATQVLINGSTSSKGMQGIYKYTSEAAPQFPQLSGKIGNVPLVEGTGENPVVSFFADTKSKSVDEYVKGYYLSVIMHEFGHSLGLRHNFAGSTRIDSNGVSSSVMDYEPGFISNIRTVPGSYDSAAIRWGYFGEKPTQTLAFCTDEDLAKRYDCNQGDVGRPEDYVVAGLIEGTTVLENLIVPLPVTVKTPMKSMMKNALKILELKDQLPASKQSQAVSDITRALERVKNARPSADLTAAGKAIAEANLQKLAASYAEATAPKKPAPVAFSPEL